MKRWAIAIAVLGAFIFAFYTWALRRAVETAKPTPPREDAQIRRRAEQRQSAIDADEARTDKELENATVDQLIDRLRARALVGVRDGAPAATGLGTDGR